MLFYDRALARGKVEFWLYDLRGLLKMHRIERNMIVATGLTHLATRACSGDSVTKMNYIAIGSDNTPVTSGDTALGNETARSSCDSNLASGSNWTLSANFAAGVGTGNVYEAAILNAAAAGDMLSRLVFGLFEKEAGDSLQINWTIGFADDGV